MEGPGVEGLRAVAAAAADGGAELIYSGGVGSLDDLRSWPALGLASLGGVIVGRALYEGRFTVAEGQAALERAGTRPMPGHDQQARRPLGSAMPWLGLCTQAAGGSSTARQAGMAEPRAD